MFLQEVSIGMKQIFSEITDFTSRNSKNTSWFLDNRNDSLGTRPYHLEGSFWMAIMLNKIDVRVVNEQSLIGLHY